MRSITVLNKILNNKIKAILVVWKDYRMEFILNFIKLVFTNDNFPIVIVLGNNNNINIEKKCDSEI